MFSGNSIKCTNKGKMLHIFTYMYTAYCRLHTVCILYAAYHKLHAMFCMLHTVFCCCILRILCTAYCILHNVYCIMHSIGQSSNVSNTFSVVNVYLPPDVVQKWEYEAAQNENTRIKHLTVLKKLLQNYFNSQLLPHQHIYSNNMT